LLSQSAALIAASVSLSEPHQKVPITTAAVITKDKILSIDLEASSFDGITQFLLQ
jgi:hypothetical protein